MSLLKYFKSPKKPTSAQTAKERLQIIISHERTKGEVNDLLPKLQKEMIEVIARYFPINKEEIEVQLGHQGDFSILELNVKLPNLSQNWSSQDKKAEAIDAG